MALCVDNFSLILGGLHQSVNLVALSRDKLFIVPIMCSSYVAVRKVTMLPQFAIILSLRVALTS